MAEVTLSGSTNFDIGPGFLDRNAWTAVGSDAIHRIVRRIKAERRNLQDASAKPYSDKGPIYVPLTGKGGRTKRSLNGNRLNTRQVISRGDLKRSRDRHFGATQAADFVNSLGGGARLAAVTPFGQVTPSGKSVKFRNYSEYKKFLGKSGERDLELSGSMLNDIDITAVGDNGVVIGFRDDRQASKMAGNIDIDDEWGFAPSDQKVLLDLIESEGLRRIQQQWSGT